MTDKKLVGLEEKATDMGMALLLARHIKNPCGTGIEERSNMRNVYLFEAKRLLPTMTDESARGYLQRIVDSYK